MGKAPIDKNGGSNSMSRQPAILVCASFLLACSTSPQPDKQPAQKAPSAAPAAAPQAQEKPPPPSPRRFLKVDGAVTIDGEEAKSGTPIGATSRIEAGKDGYALLTLEPGSIIEMRASTRLQLGKSPRKQMSVQLLVGMLWSFMPNGSSYEVVTDNAVAGVRGTVFFVSHQAPNDTYVCACDGEVDIAGVGPRAPSKHVSSPNLAHKAFHVKTAGKGKKKKTKMSRAGRLNHTDAQKMALMAAVQESQPQEAAQEADKAAPEKGAPSPPDPK